MSRHYSRRGQKCRVQRRALTSAWQAKTHLKVEYSLDHIGEAGFPRAEQARTVG